jgi:putative DNA primase/helicase
VTDFTPASGVNPKKVEWLWRDRIPKGMLTVVAGKPDQGKGLFWAHLVSHVTRGGDNAIVSAAEDDAAMMSRPRLEAAGADLDRAFLWRFRLPLQMQELRAHVLDNEVKLVVADPLAAHLTGGISRHNDSIREVTGPLEDLARESGAAILVIDHALKRIPADAHPLSAIGGSGSGIAAAARMAYIFGTDPDDSDRKILASAKSNMRDEPKAISFEVDVDDFPIVGEVASLIYDDEVEFDARRLLTAGPKGKPGRRPDKRAAAAEWLTTHLANAYASGQTKKAGDVLEDGKQYGLATKTIRRAADDMGVVRTPPGGGRNCTWQLPDEVLDAMGLREED